MTSAVRAIKELIDKKGLKDRFIISIDGPCGSGKTTLSQEIKEQFGYNVVHMDDFYLPFGDRESDWMNRIAGHMDFNRLITSVIEPYRANVETNYVSFDCHSDKYLEKINIDLNKPLLIEGSYSMHHSISKSADLKVFIDIDEKTQIDRLTKRNKDTVDKFLSMWVPFENRYFNECRIKSKSDLVL